LITSETIGGAPRGRTILLVEDHADSRAMYAEFLRLDFHVVEAADGVAALEVMAGTVPDVIVTDLALPRMDGFALIERIRGDHRLRELPVIALSGYSGTEHEGRARRAGSDVVLLKPCLPETLAQAVAAALIRRKDG
jgi:CheY-like chemotaxis protein